jgi:hypothetical protein
VSEDPSLAERVAQLEARVAQLESAGTQIRVGGEVLDADTFWALEGLKERADEPGMVLFTGAVSLPTGERREWQQAHPAAEVLADDWSQAAAALAALGHPVRLQLLREILHGVRTVADLGKTEQFGTTGQLYHHLRQLVSAGWLRTTARAHYAVPAERVIPLLTILAATRH